MKIYAAGLNTTLAVFEFLEGKNIPILLSFAYKEEFRRVGELSDDIFVDSGAFTAFTKGQEIPLDEYMAFLRDGGYGIYAGLDSIGNAKKTRENIQRMVDEGFCPIPTFHYGGDLSYLREYVSSFPYIALGGVAQLRGKKPAMRFFDQCWAEIVDGEGHPRVKVHGFAVTSRELMIRYPWYSVDSTSWVAGSKFGMIMLPGLAISINAALSSEGRKEMDKHTSTTAPIIREELKRLVEGYPGFTLERLENEYALRNTWNVFMYQEASHLFKTETFIPVHQGLFD